MISVFLKSMKRPFAVFHEALVEHLEEHLVHVRVRLFHLVEQHHRIRLAAHRLGQHAAFAVADVARRRALQRRHRVRFLVLAHVDGDEVLLAAVQRFGQRQRRLGLADARGTGQHEHADRLARVVQARARGLDALGDHLHRVVLADHALAQVEAMFRMVSISFFAMRPTGMPVQSPTTAATAW
jgi:hypothetical protein